MKKNYMIYFAFLVGALALQSEGAFAQVQMARGSKIFIQKDITLNIEANGAAAAAYVDGQLLPPDSEEPKGKEACVVGAQGVPGGTVISGDSKRELQMNSDIDENSRMVFSGAKKEIMIACRDKNGKQSFDPELMNRAFNGSAPDGEKLVQIIPVTIDLSAKPLRIKQDSPAAVESNQTIGI